MIFDFRAWYELKLSKKKKAKYFLEYKFSIEQLLSQNKFINLDYKNVLYFR